MRDCIFINPRPYLGPREEMSPFWVKRVAQSWRDHQGLSSWNVASFDWHRLFGVAVTRISSEAAGLFSTVRLTGR